MYHAPGVQVVAQVPVGYVKSEDGRIELDPDRRVQGAVRLVFEKVVELGSVRQAYQWHLHQDLAFPARRHGPGGWRTAWGRPRYSAFHRLVTIPIYGGAYAYGRTEAVVRYRGDRAVRATARRPRPEQLEIVERYTPAERFRLIVKPGMTGPMQVYGRGHLTFEERLAVERDYIENLSLARDVRLLALTVTPVFTGRGAS